MSHLRRQIRDEVAKRLTGLSITGGNVFKSRVYPLNKDLLPGICVYSGLETIERDDESVSRFQERILSVVVEIHDEFEAGEDDQLDDIAAEVEAAIFADRFLGGLAAAVDLIETESDTNAETEMLIGVTTMTFSVQYLTAEGSPGSSA